ncbi:hypothetical protein SUGI_0809840 [Cryptomeria japonica]|nr:hypothetical protein SUGI_0809840 [Cryptomeria japonica]
MRNLDEPKIQWAPGPTMDPPVGPPQYPITFAATGELMEVGLNRFDIGGRRHRLAAFTRTYWIEEVPRDPAPTLACSAGRAVAGALGRHLINGFWWQRIMIILIIGDHCASRYRQ